MLIISSSSQRHLTALAGWAQSSSKLVNAITESPKRWGLTFFFNSSKKQMQVIKKLINEFLIVKTCL